ncbi:MAG TPA: FAD-linked oxidase C-terminal domain-containing protein [Longimicrobiales bacterium]|nr:FAD-linked oxidase C-terminal domain-containing protein [Longimicrobiales bacterium]
MGESGDQARSLEQALRGALAGEVAFDDYTRRMFSTDASMYAIEPMGVVFPRHRDDVQATVEIAGRFDVPILPRGAGTSLAGQTVGPGVVLDFSRYMTDIVALDREAGTARVQPGVVQDDLNRAVAPHGLLFAPDTSTGNRATIGGMIGNNSCGARSARYGMTIDHVEAMDVVLADASTARFEAFTPDEVLRRADGRTLESRLYQVIPELVNGHADVIRAAMPSHWRRSGGYRLERLLADAGPFNLANVMVGSEGTLAVAVEATVRLVPKPAAVAALVGHFGTVNEAIEAAPAALAEGATAVELVDKMILDLARQSPVHSHLAALLHGDPGAILWVEFYGASRAEAAAGMERLQARWKSEGRGYAVLAAPTPQEQAGFQALRKAGLGLLMAAGREGERSIAFVEDTAVAPQRLAEYTRRFASILEDHGLRAGFYGHASAGCLHIRPFMNLARTGEPDRMRSVAEAVLELVMEFDGMNASEHGDGMARGEFSPRFFGDAYYRLMREVKATFDPHGRLNPGKKVDVPPMTEHLRDPALPPAPPLSTHFAFPGDGSMRGAANQCMRIGACRKSPGGGGTMCPSYMATRNEEHSTRGRANALVTALSMPDPRAALGDARLHEVLDLCLECKACKTECPLGVDMASLKSEALAHHHEIHGIPTRTRLFGHARIVNQVGSALAPLSNLPGALGPLRGLMERTLGIDRRRPLPTFRRDTLPRWFARFRSARPSRARSAGAPLRGPLLFLADCFTSYTEPEIGQASIELLDAAGWDVHLVDGVCCGRSLISKGMLNEAWEGHQALLQRLAVPGAEDTPIVGCEPSCVLTLKDELPALAEGSGTAREAAAAHNFAGRARLVDDLLADALEDGTLRPDPDSEVAGRPIVFHGHCHQKAGGALDGSVRLLQSVPGAEVQVLDAGCCGMAGSFGFEREHYDLSMAIGSQRLFPAMSMAAEEALIVATGVSCRQQIVHGTGRAPLHPALLLRKAVLLP